MRECHPWGRVGLLEAPRVIAITQRRPFAAKSSGNAGEASLCPIPGHPSCVAWMAARQTRRVVRAKIAAMSMQPAANSHAAR